MKVLAIGEILWDIIGSEEFLGGAPLNVSVNLQRCGHSALLLSSVGEDKRGQAARDALADLSLSTKYLQSSPRYSTGTAIVTAGSDEEPTFRIVRPAAFDDLDLGSGTAHQLAAEAPDWLYFGTLLQTSAESEAGIRRIRRALPGAQVFYDMNLRTGHWSPSLVSRICDGVTILKLNEVEAATLARTEEGHDSFDLARFCERWANRFGIRVICVTLGSDGCLVYIDGTALRYTGFNVRVSDTVGAGDAFAAAFLHGFHQSWTIERCATFANGLGALVASRAGATPGWDLSDVEQITRSGSATLYLGDK